MKIQFGCGGNHLEGWENYDADLDVTKIPLPFADNSVEECFTEHMPEHLSMPDCLRFFTDVHRILKPNGVFRVCVPAIGTHLEKDHARDLILGHGHLVSFNRQLLKTVLWASGFPALGIVETKRSPLDGHWKAIGAEKDDLETIRMEATK